MSTSRTHRTNRIAVVALGALAMAAPSAGAMIPPVDYYGSSSTGVSDAAQRQSGETNGGGILAEPPQVRSIVADNGLDWGDAALGGASAVFIVTLLAGGGAAIARRQRTTQAR